MKAIIILVTLIVGITAMSAQSLHDFTMKDIDGKETALASYKGKVVLVVNVASFCGFTKQYKPLEALYRKYKDRGLVVAGFPANDFGAQEPGTDKEIATFCSTTYDVTFPMFSKITVKGEHKAPLYAFLTSGGGNPALAGEIDWNFEKFLVDKDGRIIHRYKSDVDPMSEEVLRDIEKAL